MAHNQEAQHSKIPVLPLVDILFSAFAAVLGTATVAIAMMRTNPPHADQPELPYYTLVAIANSDECANTLRPEFQIKLGDDGPDITFSDASMANGATDTDPSLKVVNAWYFRDIQRTGSSDGEQTDKLCSLNSGCVRAELVVLTANQGTFTVTSAIKYSKPECQSVNFGLLLGPLKINANSLRPQDLANSISFKVP